MCINPTGTTALLVRAVFLRKDKDPLAPTLTETTPIRSVCMIVIGRMALLRLVIGLNGSSPMIRGFLIS